MADRLIQTETLQDIADAIRSKEGSSSPIPTTQMASRIENISTEADYSNLVHMIIGTMPEETEESEVE